MTADNEQIEWVKEGALDFGIYKVPDSLFYRVYNQPKREYLSVYSGSWKEWFRGFMGGLMTASIICLTVLFLIWTGL